MQRTPDEAPPEVPLPDGPDGVTWTRIDPAGVDAVHALTCAIAEVDEPGVPAARGETERRIQAAGAPARSALALQDGRPVAYGLVVPYPAAIRLPGGVLPSARAQGIGRRLLGWQVAAARAERSAGQAISARQPAPATRWAALLDRAGFVPERTFLHLRRPGGPVPRTPLPGGLTSVPFEARFDEPLRVAKNRAFADHWRSNPESPEAWAQHQLGPWLRRDLSRLALDASDHVAGFVVTWEQEEVLDVVYVSLVGTDPARRGQGVARSLLAEVVAASATAGRPVVTLDVDAESATGAGRLYASVGFERVLETVMHGLPA